MGEVEGLPVASRGDSLQEHMAALPSVPPPGAAAKTVNSYRKDWTLGPLSAPELRSFPGELEKGESVCGRGTEGVVGGGEETERGARGRQAPHLGHVLLCRLCVTRGHTH